MATGKRRIDPYLFESHLRMFRAFVKKQSGIPFKSFSSHPYTDEQESYKYKIYSAARKALAFQRWKKSDIGNGEIIAKTIQSIEISGNNLLQWQPKYGEQSRLHNLLYEAKNNIEQRKNIEKCLFKLYREAKECESFEELLKIFGKKYALIAYFFFIKDKSKYLPIAPTYFEKAFNLLGVNLKLSGKCSWENYSTYIGCICELKNMLTDALSNEVTLLDAHSFAWILSSQMKDVKISPDHKRYLKLEDTEREAIIKARIGQGQFRESLIEYWSVCAVTGCADPTVLRASHIKPWSESTVTERLDLYNGLLLSPALDTCFDLGYVSFTNRGKIMLSDVLSEDDYTAMGIHKDMKLKKIESKHIRYLEYHYKNIFR